MWRALSTVAILLLPMVSLAVVPGDPSFVHAFSDRVWFLRWTERNGQIVGQFQSVVVRPDLTLQSNDRALGGTRNGNDITLAVGGMLGGAPLGPVYAGRLRGSTLILDIPLQNGNLETVVFHSGDAKDYNRAVAALRTRVNDAIRARQRAADLAARQRAVMNANDQMWRSMRDIGAAEKRLDRSAIDAEIGPAIDQSAKILTRMRREDAKLRKDAARSPLTCGWLHGVVEAELEGVLHAELTGSLAGNHGGVFVPRRDSVASNISRLGTAIQHMEQEYIALQAAVQRNTLGTPGPIFTPAQVQAMATLGYQRMRDANDAMQAAEAQEDRILADAQAVYKSAKDFVAGLACTE